MTYQETFTPENVDERIDQLSSSLRRTLEGRSDYTVVQRLNALYREDQRSTERVWERLVRQVNADDASAQPAQQLFKVASDTSNPVARQGQSMKEAQTRQRGSSDRRVHEPRRGAHLLTVVAATVVAVLLTSSLLWVLHSGNAEKTPATHQGPSEIYTNGPDGLAKFDSQSHKQLWRTTTTDSKENLYDNWESPIVIGQTVIIYFSPGYILAFDANTGASSWSHKFANDFQDVPFQSDGLLYVQTLDKAAHPGTLYAMNPATGAIQHMYQPPLSGGWWWLAVSDNMLFYIGATGPEGPENDVLYAVLLPTNKVLWQMPAGMNKGDAMDGLSTASGVVYVESTDFHTGRNYLFAFNEQNGQVVWRFPEIQQLDSWKVTSTSLLLIQSFPQSGMYSLQSYSLQTHKRLWQYQYQAKSGDNIFFTLDPETIYMTLSDPRTSQVVQLVAIDSGSGHRLWQKAPAPGIFLASSQGVLYLIGRKDTNSEGTIYARTVIYALHPADGSQIWAWSIGIEAVGMSITIT